MAKRCQVVSSVCSAVACLAALEMLIMADIDTVNLEARLLSYLCNIRVRTWVLSIWQES